MEYKKCTSDMVAYYATLIAASCTRVFGGEPWKEHKICKICNKKFGLQDELVDLESDCKHELKDFWETGSLVKKVTKAFSHKGLSMWVCEDSKTRDVVGFTWGFIENKQTVSKILDGKLTAFLAQYPNKTKIAYQAAVGVLEPYRESGIAKELYSKRYEDLVGMGAEVFIVRTSWASPMFDWLLRMNYQVIDDYKENQNDDRYILALNAKDLKQK